MKILAIDPGTTQSAYVHLLFDNGFAPCVLDHGKCDNPVLARLIHRDDFGCDSIVIEQVASYGKPVGDEVFETVFWSGRFVEAAFAFAPNGGFHRMKRADVKMALCHQTKGVNDAVIRQRLIDLYGGKSAVGTKKNPGPLYGITKDEWQALALGYAFWLKNKGA